ncbi:MAG: outer membrane lipoprotein carrier protein LolA [Melioribacteraceae bacterium]|nr:outer membrane lipoprotein carrier protein LolA [Melioribacteraceae bacterium]
MMLKFLILLSFPVMLFAQSTDSIIDKVQKKFDQIDNLKAKFSQTIYSSQSVKPLCFEGEFYYKKEDSFRITLPNREIISDGKSVWNYDERENKVVISDAEFDEASFSLKEIIYNYPKKCDLSLVDGGSGKYYIKAIPNDLELSFKEVYLTINNKYLLNKVEIIDFNNMKFTFELFSIKLNQDIDDKLFQFFSPDEVEVIDLR